MTSSVSPKSPMVVFLESIKRKVVVLRASMHEAAKCMANVTFTSVKALSSSCITPAAAFVDAPDHGPCPEIRDAASAGVKNFGVKAVGDELNFSSALSETSQPSSNVLGAQAAEPLVAALDEGLLKFLATITITIKALGGKTFEITEVRPSDRVNGLKQRIQEVLGIPLEQQRLISAGRCMEDGKNLSSYKIGDGSLLHLVLRLRGGRHRAVR